MPSKFDFLSPGIQITEVDESIITPTPDEDGPIIIGRTRKGPAMKPVKVKNMADYISVFGTPVPGGSSESGDVWRDGAGCKAPTYAAYAAQAWLASGEAPVNVVRLLGEGHDTPKAGVAVAKAGWQLTTAKPSSTLGDNSTAYGLFVVNSGSNHFGTGSLAAVFYCDSGALRLSGTLSGMVTDTTSAAETFIDSVADGLSFVLESVDTSGNVDEKIQFSFDRNSSNYIRNVLNTDPTLTNASLYSATDRKLYWLGESYIRHVEEALGSTSFSKGGQFGILMALHTANQGADATYNWGYQKENMEAAKSGWVIGNDSGVPADYSATSATKMFRLVMLHEGESSQSQVLIAFEDLKLPSNPAAYGYSSFTLRVMDTSGNTLEKFTNLVMDPSSANYLLRRIGDMYQTWDAGAKRYRSYGDFQNASDYIRVEKPSAGLPGDKALLPFGFLGPARPKGFVTGLNANGVLPMHDTRDDDGLLAAKAVDALVLGPAGGVTTAADDDNFTIQVPIAAGGSNTLITIKMVGSVGSPDPDTIEVTRSSGGTSANTNAERIIAAIQGSGHGDWDGLKMAWGTISGENVADGIKGISAAAGTTASEITLTCTSGGTAGNSITLANIAGGIYDVAVTFTGGTDEDDWATAPVKVGGAVPYRANGATDGVYFRNGTTAFTASFTFPSIAMRKSGSDGYAANPYKAYFGINPKIDKDSTIHDEDYCDYLRGMASGLKANLHTPGVDFEHSIAFSLDDIVIDSNLNTVTWTAGSRKLADAAKRSWTAASGTVGLLDKNVTRWVMPMYGGRDGLDIQQIEPFGNHNIVTTGDNTSYVNNTLNMALDCVADEEVVPANLMLMPGVRHTKITTKMIRVCETRQDALAILDLEDDYLPADQQTGTARTAARPNVGSAITSLKNRNLNSSYACAFFPWVQVADTLNNSELLWVPSSVAALGALAQSQAASDVWFAPAGFNRGGLGDLGGPGGPRVIQAKMRLDSSERDDLYVQNINPIATFPNEGVVIFGQKTLQQTQSALDRINVRRLMLYLKRKISNVAKGVLFDQNVEATWNRFKSNASPILDEVQSRYGLTEYKLILDETTTTPDLIDRNILYAKVYLKPARAIEFIAIDFIISKTGAEFA